MVGLPEAALQLEGLAFAQHVVAGAREFVRDRLERHDGVGAGLLALVETLRLGTEAHREVGRLDKRPRQILVAVLRVAFALLLAVGDARAIHAAAIRTEVPDRREARHRPR